MDRPLRIVQLASEAAPFVKTGGLGDVVGALSRALSRRGHEVHLVLPLYGVINRESAQVRPQNFRVSTGLAAPDDSLGVFRAGPTGEGTPQVWMLGHPLFDGPAVYDYGEDHLRFAAYCRGALELVRQVVPDPDVIHLHDWQTGLAAVALRAGPERHALSGAPIVFTIHNLNYNGSYPVEALDEIGVPRSLYTSDSLEFHGRAALIKGGLVYADELTTVSPRYAAEIQTVEFGAGLDGLLRYRTGRLQGILNGIDDEEWNPATDSHIAARYDVRDLSGKSACKADLQRSLGLDVDARAPLFGVVSRLAWQKGIDLVADIADGIIDRGGQVAILGTGDAQLEGRFWDLTQRRPGRCAARFGFDDGLAHRMVAGSDMFLVPSRYEPCGLTQMYALRYGTVPVVRAVGGLDDTVMELDAAHSEGSGFKFGATTAGALWSAVGRAWRTYDNAGAWTALQRRGMMLDHSWNSSAEEYESLFHRLAHDAHDG